MLCQKNIFLSERNKSLGKDLSKVKTSVREQKKLYENEIDELMNNFEREKNDLKRNFDKERQRKLIKRQSFFKKIWI